MRVTSILEIGLSGRCGDVVYFRVRGETYVKRAPRGYNKIPTAKQSPGRIRFAEAQAFAKSVISDPVLKAQYQARAGMRCSAYSLAVSDYMRQVC